MIYSCTTRGTVSQVYLAVRYWSIKNEKKILDYVDAAQAYLNEKEPGYFKADEFEPERGPRMSREERHCLIANIVDDVGFRVHEDLGEAKGYADGYERAGSPHQFPEIKKKYHCLALELLVNDDCNNYLVETDDIPIETYASDIEEHVKKNTWTSQKSHISFDYCDMFPYC